MAFTEKDIREDEQALRELTELGSRGTPTTVVGGEEVVVRLTRGRRRVGKSRLVKEFLERREAPAQHMLFTASMRPSGRDLSAKDVAGRTHRRPSWFAAGWPSNHGARP